MSSKNYDFLVELNFKLQQLKKERNPAIGD
jgi:hypothetical protein